LFISSCAFSVQGTPTGVATHTAKVNGVVFSNVSGETSYWVEYGQTDAYGSETQHASLTIDDEDGHPVSVQLSGLASSTSYNYRLCAKDSQAGAGTGCSANDTLTTWPFKITVDKGLYPAFDPAIHDYVTRCGGEPVTVEVSAPNSTTVGVDGEDGRGGQFSRQVDLETGQAFTIETTIGFARDTYHVRCLPSDFPEWSFTRSGQPTLAYTLATPSISLTGTSRYMAFFDAHGVPVWWYRAANPPTDARLLTDNTLAFSSAAGGFAAGPGSDYQFRRLDGTLVRTVSTVGWFTDDHDLVTLGNGNYLLETYKPRDHVDLSAFGGPADATVVDGELQEIEPDGDLVWSWNSKDHIALAETGRWWSSVTSAPVTLSDGRTAYDHVHMNSVDVNGNGIVLSFRHTDAIYRINRGDGSIQWKLGGTTTPQSLDIAGESSTAPLGGQHDARVLSDGSISIHDNGTGLGRAPRVVRYLVDASAGTATRVGVLSDSDVPVSFCCGSARRLASGGWLVNWGGQPVVSEYAPGGARVSKLIFTDRFSYRAIPIEAGRLSAATLRQGMNTMFPR
jgi:hypothetical protein